MQLLQKNLKTRCLHTAFCICVQMRACRSWLWSSFSWDSSVRWGEFIIMTPLTWTRLKAASDTYHLTTLSLRFRAISRDLHPFSKRPSQSSTAGTALSIRWLFPRSGGLVRPSFSPPRPLTTGLAFFAPPLSCRKALTEEEALVWLQIVQPVVVSSGGEKAATTWLLLSIVFFVVVFSPSHPIQPSASLLKEEILVATYRKIQSFHFLASVNVRSKPHKTG